MMARRDSLISLGGATFRPAKPGKDTLVIISRGAAPRDNDTYGFDRTWQEGPRVHAQRPERRDPQALRVRRAAGDSLLLSERRHARLHAGDVRVPGRAARAEEVEGGGAGRQHPRREEQ